MPEHVSCIVWRGFSDAVTQSPVPVSETTCFKEMEPEVPHPAPLMYQSPGTFLKPAKLSLGILKCAISGASPLRGGARSHRHV